MLVFSTELPELLLDQLLQAFGHLQGHFFDTSLHRPAPHPLNQTVLLDKGIYHRDHEERMAVRSVVNEPSSAAGGGTTTDI